MTTRRRFLAISASAAALPNVSLAAPIYTWVGVALGAKATLRLAHPDAKAISARVAREISRLEDIFTLYRPDSQLAQLNRNGVLYAPSFEMLACLSMTRAVHEASAGRFDPTIQPLWAVYAAASAAGAVPDQEALDKARGLIGLERVRFDATSVTLEAGMSVTLNGIAQGYIADRVAAMLSAEGLGNILINTGEFRAVGAQPDGRAWPVKLASGGLVALVSRALATSAPLGTVFDENAKMGHILDPRTRRFSRSPWHEISVSAKSAALADALSTVACLFETRAEIDGCVAKFPDARVEAAVTV